jgi:hypothetical protein
LVEFSKTTELEPVMATIERNIEAVARADA